FKITYAHDLLLAPDVVTALGLRPGRGGADERPGELPAVHRLRAGGGARGGLCRSLRPADPARRPRRAQPTRCQRGLPPAPASAHLEQTGSPDATPAQGPRGAGDLAAGADAVQAPADGRRVPHRLAQPPRAVTAVTRFGRPVEQAGYGPAPGGGSAQ